MIFTLQPYEIADNWPWIEQFLRRVENPGWQPSDIRDALEGAHAQLWGSREGTQPVAIWITRLENIGSTRYGLVWVAAGTELEEGLRLFRAHTEPWFRLNGCKWVELVGRKGWERVLGDYEERARVFVKELA